MKSSPTYPIQGFLYFVTVVLLVLSASAAKAQVLLTVNISNPDQIVITATGNLLTIASTSSRASEGFDLLGLFNSSTNFDNFTVDSTNLTFSGYIPSTSTSGSLTLTNAEGDDITGANPSPNQPDLNLFDNADVSGTQMVLTNGQTAFTGSMTLDITLGPDTNNDGGTTYSGLTTANINTTGGKIELYGSQEVIGSYVVVTPEPQTWAELIAGIACLGFFRRRSSRA